MKKIVLALALCLTSLSIFAVDTAVTGHARLTIVDGITVSESQQLNFGSIDVTGTAGTVTISPDGLRTSTNVTEIGTNFSSGSFTINGTPALALTYTVQAGSITLLGQNTGQPLTVSVFTPFAPTGTTDASGTAILKVGATAAVSATQATDVYTGTYEVTISHN